MCMEQTHEIPIDRLKLEELKPIDGVPEYLVIREETRTISRIVLFHTLGTNILFHIDLLVERLHFKYSMANLALLWAENMSVNMKYFQEAAGIKGKKHFKGLMSEIMKENNLP